MSNRPWTLRTWVVAVVSMAASSTSITLAGQGIWWPVVLVGGAYLGMAIVGWWLWRQERIDRETNEGDV